MVMAVLSFSLLVQAAEAAPAPAPEPAPALAASSAAATTPAAGGASSHVQTHAASFAKSTAPTRTCLPGGVGAGGSSGALLCHLLINIHLNVLCFIARNSFSF